MLKNIRFKDGSCYEGEVNEAGEPHGKEYFEGEFEDGRLVGSCVHTMVNGDFHINAEGAYLEVTDVTDDSVTYVVKSCFLSNGGPIKETIKRGETKKYKDEVEHTGRMYDDDFTYTSGSELIVSCK